VPERSANTRAGVRAGLLAAVLLVQALAVAGAEPARAETPVLGESALTAEQIVDWYEGVGIRSKSPTDVRRLAEIFLDEGAAHGVRGDIAFAQSMLETGYLRFGGQVRPSDHNFSGLGACDRCARGLAFPSPTLGVRAQIQHLLVYADPAADAAALPRPLADIRFGLVRPPGRAPTWERMGNGNWATDPLYSGKVLSIWRSMLRWSGVPEPAGTTRPALAVLATARGAARLGTWGVTRQPLARGVRTIGEPASRRPAAGGCLVRWPERGLAALVDAEADPCADPEGLVRWARVSDEWARTTRGLSPGDTLAELRDAYPRARRRGARWWLVWGRDGRGTPVRARLAAEVRGGTVRALWVTPGRAA
jgi:hypothetical protein